MSVPVMADRLARRDFDEWLSAVVIVTVRDFTGRWGGGPRSVNRGFFTRSAVCDASSDLLGKEGGKKRSQTHPEDGNTGCITGGM